MPVDRRALRKSLAALRDGGASKWLLGFDFDCTLTVRHFYKVFAWGYTQGSASAHVHCEAFFSWCRDHNVEPEMQEAPRNRQDLSDPMGLAIECFCRSAGETAFRDVFREVFLGGPARISLVAAWLERMQREGVEFAIVTAGVSSAVLRALTTVPEWQPFFPANRVWDVSQGRHSVRSVMDQKLLILRELCPPACRILLVDDSISRDFPQSWVLSAAAAEVYEGLPYEGPGVDEGALSDIEKKLLP
mmetsp:Transcript_77461/g.214206  ORF Transcript_77461/g.214206 Transcript_77461/m.214206 type:complete len:246 (-) Transcript_77461:120-857(-)